MLKNVALFTLVLFSSAALSNDQIKAKELCVIAHLKVESLKERTWICDHEMQASIFWSCVNKRIDEGEPFKFAYTQCDPKPTALNQEHLGG